MEDRGTNSAQLLLLPPHNSKRTMGGLSEGAKIFFMSIGPGNMPLIILGICGAAGYSKDAVARDPATPNYFQNTKYPVKDPDPNLWKTIFSGPVGAKSVALRPLRYFPPKRCARNIKKKSSPKNY